MVLRQDSFQVFGKGSRLFDVAIGDVCDQVNNVVEGLDGFGSGG